MGAGFSPLGAFAHLCLTLGLCLRCSSSSFSLCLFSAWVAPVDGPARSPALQPEVAPPSLSPVYLLQAQKGCVPSEQVQT